MVSVYITMTKIFYFNLVWGVSVPAGIFSLYIMDADWRREKLEILLEKIDRGRANGLGCNIFDSNLATNRGQRGNNTGPTYGRVKIRFPDGSKKVY